MVGAIKKRGTPISAEESPLAAPSAGSADPSKEFELWSADQALACNLRSMSAPEQAAHDAFLADIGVVRAKREQMGTEYVFVPYSQIHWTRKQAIARAHPEVSALMGPDGRSVLHVLFCVLLQFFLASYMPLAPWPLWFVGGYVVGACICHALWVLIHDACHDCCLPWRAANLALICVANLPHVWPSGIAFRFYHLRHHSHLNTTYDDPDLPMPWEDRLFGHSSVGKFVWMCLFPLFQGIRTLHDRHGVPTFDFWSVVNFVGNVAVSAVFGYFVGGLGGFVYLAVSSYFAVGMHPLGARWIAEHYAVDPPQETYSYYGPVNAIAYNIGYHNEHHDFPNVPWNKLPALTRIAPEFYEPLAQHTSYLRVLYQWVMHPNFSLRTRVVRKPLVERDGRLRAQRADPSQWYDSDE